MSKIILFFILFLLSVTTTHAATTLSSTQVGTTAVLTSTVPPNACTVYKMGESKTETITGFYISAFSKNDKGTVIGNWSFVDLSQSSVRLLTISGKNITGFKPSTRETGAKNSADIIKTQRTFDFDTPLTYNPSDSAILVLDNVKVTQTGTVSLGFGFFYNNGVNPPCISSGMSTLQIGNSPITTKSPLATPAKTAPTYTSFTPTPAGSNDIAITNTHQSQNSPSTNTITQFFTNIKLNLQYLFSQLTGWFK